MLLPLRVVFKDVQTVLSLNLVIQPNPMGDLIFLFHQVKFLLDGGIILISIFAHLEKYFNHILHALVDIGLV
jgi:hypothetical protein